MFAVTEAEAAAIRQAIEQDGELAAAIELRRLLPGIADNAQARECVRIIASWQPLPLRSVRRSRRALTLFGAGQSSSCCSRSDNIDRWPPRSRR